MRRFDATQIWLSHWECPLPLLAERRQRRIIIKRGVQVPFSEAAPMLWPIRECHNLVCFEAFTSLKAALEFLADMKS